MLSLETRSTGNAVGGASMPSLMVINISGCYLSFVLIARNVFEE